MTIFEKPEPKLPPARKQRFKAFTAAGRAKWRQGLGWFDRLEMDAQEKHLSKSRRFWLRMRISVLSTVLALVAWLALAAVIEAASYVWFYLGWAATMCLNAMYLVRVIWNDHWKE